MAALFRNLSQVAVEDIDNEEKRKNHGRNSSKVSLEGWIAYAKTNALKTAAVFWLAYFCRSRNDR